MLAFVAKFLAHHSALTTSVFYYLVGGGGSATTGFHLQKGFVTEGFRFLPHGFGTSLSSPLIIGQAWVSMRARTVFPGNMPLPPAGHRSPLGGCGLSRPETLGRCGRSHKAEESEEYLALAVLVS